MTKETCLTFSTAHVSAATRAMLTESTDPGSPENLIHNGISVYPKGEYGWFLYLCGSGNLSGDLGRLVGIAEKEGASLIVLDRDEEPDEGLPIYPD